MTIGHEVVLGVQERRTTESAWITVIPGLFVVLWSTAFIAGKLGTPYASPMTFLTLRYAGATAIFLTIALITQAPWPRTWTAVGHATVAALLLHIVFVGGTLYAYRDGVEAGAAALIASLQPLLTAVLVGPLLGESVSRRQWWGFMLGLVGVTLVVWHKLSFGIGSVVGVSVALLALIGITSGTVYQKRFCSMMDIRTGNTLQFTAALIIAGVLSYAEESHQVIWSPAFLLALSWMTLAISVGAVALLYVMIHRGAVARVASLFYLVPLVTALLAWPMFGEQVSPVGGLGLLLTVVGVAFARREG
jgi:drug/metabolite transporter (DMT)-like permease